MKNSELNWTVYHL